YLALNSGRMSTTANRKTRTKSSRISVRRESFKRVFKSVACRFDGRVVAVAPLETIELPPTQNPAAMQAVAQQQPQNRKSVACAGDERGRRGLREVARVHGHFIDAELQVDDLRQDFLVENEFVRIHLQVHGFQHLAAE